MKNDGFEWVQYTCMDSAASLSIDLLAISAVIMNSAELRKVRARSVRLPHSSLSVFFFLDRVVWEKSPRYRSVVECYVRPQCIFSDLFSHHLDLK